MFRLVRVATSPRARTSWVSVCYGEISHVTGESERKLRTGSWLGPEVFRSPWLRSLHKLSLLPRGLSVTQERRPSCGAM